MDSDYLSFNAGRGNFGDFINYLFWNSLCKKKFKVNFDKDKSHHFLTTGSILEFATDKSIIFGTGFISSGSDLGGGKWASKSNQKHCTPSHIYSVRGKLTRDKLIRMGIPCPESYGDPLLLFPAFYNPRPQNISNTIGIIPHYVDKNSPELNSLKSFLISQGYSIKIINIITYNNYSKFINEIASCDTIISSSLHGVIMGLVYNKKTIFRKFSNKLAGNIYKFYDFFSSLSVQYNYVVGYENMLDNYIVLDNNKLAQLQYQMIDMCPLFTKKIKDGLLKKMNPKFLT